MAPHVASTARLDHTATDGANWRFESPGSAQPTWSPERALAQLERNALAGDVEAVLAVWTRIASGLPDSTPVLVSVLRNRNVPLQPSRGPAVCGDRAAIVDADNGIVYFRQEGNPLF